ncbi:MAG: glutamine amidotransferase [Bradymonadia bacterium]
MRIALLKMGTTMPTVKARYGDYEEWFAQALDIPTEALHVLDAHSPTSLPHSETFDGVIISGSAFSVYDRAPWSERAATWLRPFIDNQTPILGVCYGHQLLAQEMGATVALSPGGREIGVCTVDRIQDDPIFDGLSSPFTVVQTHSDAVLTPVDGGEVIATSPQAFNQAMRIGHSIRTLQWHPEMTHTIIEEYIKLRAEDIEQEFDADHVQGLLNAITPVESGRSILNNFIKHFVCRPNP